jgi:hypothetical protein
VNTAWLDCSNIYGTSKSQSDGLRELQGGRLKMTDNLIPIDKFSEFITGSERANENLGTALLYNIFYR